MVTKQALASLGFAILGAALVLLSRRQAGLTREYLRYRHEPTEDGERTADSALFVLGCVFLLGGLVVFVGSLLFP